MLVILTFRDGEETPKSLIEILTHCTKPVTTIALYPLDNQVLQELVLNTFYNNHRSSAAIQYDAKEELEQRLNVIKPLVDIIYTWTRGNPFYAKQFLKTMKRKDDIWFDWNEKHWKFRLDNITKLFDNTQHHGSNKKTAANHEVLTLTGNMDNSKTKQELFDVRNLVSHLRSLDLSAQYFLMWASLIGHMFNFRRIKWLMMATTTGDMSSDESSSTSSNHSSSNKSAVALTSPPCYNHASSSNAAATAADAAHILQISLEEEEKCSNQAMLGLQVCLNEGIIQFKAGNDFQFIHDRYYQAAAMLIQDPAQRENMHFKIGQLLMMEEEVEEEDNIFLLADHFVKSVGIIRLLEKTKCYRDVLIRAGNEALSSGALQISATYFDCALSLLDEDIDKRWVDGPDTCFSETLNLYMKILDLNCLKYAGHYSEEDENAVETRSSMMKQIMQHAKDNPVERAQAWRIQARIDFQYSHYRKGLDCIFVGLEELGIVVDIKITEEEALEYYRAIKPSIVKPGFDILSKSGPCKNLKQMAIMTLLSEACTGAYWVNPVLVDFCALKLCELSLKYGYAPASGGGFIWAGCTATRVKEFEFAAQLGQFGVSISEKYASNSEIARAIIVHHAMLAQWTGVHVREYIFQFQRAYKFALAAGDRVSSGWNIA
jgi:predicted ATPase